MNLDTLVMVQTRNRKLPGRFRLFNVPRVSWLRLMRYIGRAKRLHPTRYWNLIAVTKQDRQDVEHVAGLAGVNL
jgi:hypothetical protein